MTSIRTYDGKIYLCKTCGQPCYINAEVGSSHFKEQWDGIFCQRYPLAGELLEMEWHAVTLATLKRSYPDTYPYLSS